MHPFGGTPVCSRCSRLVYAAEQIMGPGRKLYHKPCLTCASCRKRLDSYTLVEHDEEPYCKTCHVKTFGTRDLRHANLPDRDDVLISPPTSPVRAGAPLPPPSTMPAPALPPRKTPTGNATEPSRAASPLFRPNRVYNPIRPSNTEPPKPPDSVDSTEGDTQPGASEAIDEEGWEPPAVHGAPSHNGRGAGGLPRTVPLDATMAGPPRTPSPVKVQPTVAEPESASLTGDGATSGRMTIPLGIATTGIRYGAALSGRMTSPVATTPMRQWGGGTPVCGKCQKTVYHAEQVKAIGKTYHRNCLRCTECNTLLDSSRLTEKEGNPYCKHCYGKLYGPAGSGYALLGKAGG